MEGEDGLRAKATETEGRRASESETLRSLRIELAALRPLRDELQALKQKIYGTMAEKGMMASALEADTLRQDQSRSEQKYKNLKQDYDNLRQEVDGIREDPGLRAKASEADTLRQDQSRLEQKYKNLKQDYDNLRREVDGIKQQKGLREMAGAWARLDKEVEGPTGLRAQASEVITLRLEVDKMNDQVSAYETLKARVDGKDGLDAYYQRCVDASQKASNMIWHHLNGLRESIGADAAESWRIEGAKGAPGEALAEYLDVVLERDMDLVTVAEGQRSLLAKYEHMLQTTHSALKVADDRVEALEKELAGSKKNVQDMCSFIEEMDEEMEAAGR